MSIKIKSKRTLSNRFTGDWFSGTGEYIHGKVSWNCVLHGVNGKSIILFQISGFIQKRLISLFASFDFFVLPHLSQQSDFTGALSYILLDENSKSEVFIIIHFYIFKNLNFFQQFPKRRSPYLQQLYGIIIAG